MAELIDKGAITFRCRYSGDCRGSIEACFKCRDYVCDFEDIQDMSTVTEAEIRTNAIEEFAEKVKQRIKEEVALLKNEREEAREYDDEQVIFAVNNQLRAFDYSLRMITEQLKMECVDPSHVRCLTCKHYDGEYNVPPICYLCCKGYEDNYEKKEE